jgi:bacterioferritin-associated ferredoxin
MYVCLCNAITDRDFRAHVTNKNCTVLTVYQSLGTKPRCGKCLRFAKQLLQQVVEIANPQPMSAGAD